MRSLNHHLRDGNAKEENFTPKMSPEVFLYGQVSTEHRMSKKWGLHIYGLFLGTHHWLLLRWFSEASGHSILKRCWH